MSLSRTVAHGTTIQIAGKGISTVLGFIAIAIMTRALGAEQFGWYITAASFLQFVGVLSDFGFTVTTSNMLSEPRFERGQLFSTTFSWRLVTAIFFQGLAPLVFLFFPYSTEIKWAVAIMTISFFAQALNQVFIGLYREQLRVVISIAGEVVGRLVLVIGIALVAYGKTGFMPMMWAVTLASVISTLYYSYFSPRISLSFDPFISRALFKKIWPTAVSVIFTSLYYQAGRILLPLSVSQTEVGYFGAATRVYDIVVQVAALIMGIMMPLVTYAWSRNLYRDFRERFQLSLTAMALIILPSIAGLFALAKPLMIFVAGDEFISSAVMLQWTSFALLGSFLGMTFGHIALAIDRQKHVLWIYISDALISFAAFLYFIPRFGWKGAAAVMIFSEVYAGVLLMLATIRYAQSIPSFLPVYKIAFASFIMGLVLFKIDSLPLLASMLLGTLLYATLIVLFRVTSLQTLKTIFSRQKIAQG